MLNGKYNKAIGATLGALVAWGGALGIGWLGSFDPAILEPIFAIIGAGGGAAVAPKNNDW